MGKKIKHQKNKEQSKNRRRKNAWVTCEEMNIGKVAHAQTWKKHSESIDLFGGEKSLTWGTLQHSIILGIIHGNNFLF